MKSVGAAISEPIAQTIGSALFVNVRSFCAISDETATPNRPEIHVTTPKIKEILLKKEMLSAHKHQL